MGDKQASHVLFYSTRCKFCNQVLFKANKIKDIECVNIEEIQIPSYVKGVPALLIDRNDIVYGAKVFEFVQKLSESQINAVNSQVGDFSFIEESQDGLTNGYTYITDDPSIFGENLPEQTDSERGEYNDPKLIEKLIAERAKDLPNPQPRV